MGSEMCIRDRLQAAEATFPDNDIDIYAYAYGIDFYPLIGISSPLVCSEYVLLVVDLK